MRIINGVQERAKAIGFKFLYDASYNSSIQLTFKRGDVETLFFYFFSESLYTNYFNETVTVLPRRNMLIDGPEAAWSTEVYYLNEETDFEVFIERYNLALTDEQILEGMHSWLDHYINSGGDHYKGTPEWRIQEIYWDRIVDRVINEVGREPELEEFLIHRINKIYN
jgi:hypothetical protein